MIYKVSIKYARAYVPVHWLSDEVKHIISELSEINGVSVELQEQGEILAVKYRLNQEPEVLNVVLIDAKEPQFLKDKFSLFRKL